MMRNTLSERATGFVVEQMKVCKNKVHSVIVGYSCDVKSTKSGDFRPSDEESCDLLLGMSIYLAVWDQFLY